MCDIKLWNNDRIEQKRKKKSKNRAPAVLSAGAFSAWATSQSPGLPETLATAYNPGTCLLALPVIVVQIACLPHVETYVVKYYKNVKKLLKFLMKFIIIYYELRLRKINSLQK